MGNLIDTQSFHLGVAGGQIQVGFQIGVVEPLDCFGTHIQQGTDFGEGLTGATVYDPFGLSMGVAFGRIGKVQRLVESDYSPYRPVAGVESGAILVGPIYPNRGVYGWCTDAGGRWVSSSVGRRPAR
jgi:hypothetical protein